VFIFTLLFILFDGFPEETVMGLHAVDEGPIWEKDIPKEFQEGGGDHRLWATKIKRRPFELNDIMRVGMPEPFSVKSSRFPSVCDDGLEISCP
jgi:hypothetical protein